MRSRQIAVTASNTSDPASKDDTTGSPAIRPKTGDCQSDRLVGVALGRRTGEDASAQKFKTRYATFGFSDEANLDDGAMWPTAFALTELTAADEARIGALVKKAVS